MISARFADDQRFCDHYKRNNKAKGRKNLRCFPDCRLTGHVKTGYCGRPVICEVAGDVRMPLPAPHAPTPLVC